MNKLDRPGASFSASIASILTHRLHRRPLVLTLPIASFDPQDYLHAEPGVQGLVDLVKWEIWQWDKAGQVTRHPIPRTASEWENFGLLPSSHPVARELLPARTALLDTLSGFSEPLLNTLLELPEDDLAYGTVPTSVIMPALRAASLANQVLPVLCGSALKHVGTDIVMDYIGELFASPLDVLPEPLPKTAPVRLLAWKVGWDKRRKTWNTFVRVYSGNVLDVQRLTCTHVRQDLSSVRAFSTIIIAINVSVSPNYNFFSQMKPRRLTNCLSVPLGSSLG